MIVCSFGIYAAKKELQKRTSYIHNRYIHEESYRSYFFSLKNDEGGQIGTSRQTFNLLLLYIPTYLCIYLSTASLLSNPLTRPQTLHNPTSNHLRPGNRSFWSFPPGKSSRKSFQALVSQQPLHINGLIFPEFHTRHLSEYNVL